MIISHVFVLKKASRPEKLIKDKYNLKYIKSTIEVFKLQLCKTCWDVIKAMKDESESCRHFIEILSQIYYKFFTKSNFTNAMDNKWNIKIVETETKAV